MRKQLFVKQWHSLLDNQWHKRFKREHPLPCLWGPRWRKSGAPVSFGNLSPYLGEVLQYCRLATKHNAVLCSALHMTQLRKLCPFCRDSASTHRKQITELWFSVEFHFPYFSVRWSSRSASGLEVLTPEKMWQRQDRKTIMWTGKATLLWRYIFFLQGNFFNWESSLESVCPVKQLNCRGKHSYI